jgi:hypothetical protein
MRNLKIGIPFISYRGLLFVFTRSYKCFCKLGVCNLLSEASGGRSKVVLVVFLGGCTLTEVSALRYLSEHGDANYIVLTTHMINARKMLGSAMASIPTLEP